MSARPPVRPWKLAWPAEAHPTRVPPAAWARLAAGAEPAVRATLVTGFAGCGKTRVAAAWAQAAAEAGRPAAWLTLDARDADPRALLAGLAAAIARVVPAGGEPLAGLASSAPDAAALAASAGAWLAEGVLAAGAPAGVLVLDEVDHLAGVPAAAAALLGLAEDLPEGWQLVLVGRAAPELPLARWRARRALVELGPAELRLTDAEMARLLADLVGEPPPDAERLVAPLAGWPAALVLAAYSASGRGTGELLGRLDAALAGGAAATAFVAEEVYMAQPAPCRALMGAIALAGRLEPGAAALPGVPDVAEATRLLAERHLLVPVDAAGRIWALPEALSGLLRARVAEELGPAGLAARRAELAGALAAHDPEGALGLALAAGDVPAAGALLERLAAGWLARREGARLAAAIADLPAAALEDDATCAFWAGEAARQAGDQAGAARLLGVAAARAAGTPLGARAAVHLAAAEAARGAADVATRLDAAEPHLGPEDGEARALAASVRGALALERNDMPAARAAFAAALAAAGPAAAPAARARALHNLGLVATRAGRLDEAAERYGEAIAAFEAAGMRPQPLTLANLAAVAIYRRRPAEAWAAAEEALALARALALPRDEAYARLMLGGAALEAGDAATATGHFAAARALALRLDDRLAATKAVAGEAECAAALGEGGRADALVAEAVALTGWPLDDPRQGDLALTAAAVAAAAGRLDEARARLTALAGRFREAGAAYRQAEAERRLAALAQAPGAPGAGARAAADGPAPPQLEVRCFGRMEARIGGATIRGQAWQGQLPRLLLAYLLACPEGVAKEGLVELLYPDDVRGRTAALMVVSRVRQAFEPALGKAAAARVIQLVEGRYQLDPALARRTDMHAFLAHHQAGMDARRPDAERQAACEAALACHRGPFLADVDERYGWVALERERFRRLVQDVHAARMLMAMEAGAEVAALDAAEANLVFDPCSEAAHLVKIRALMRLGRREAALRQGRTMVAWLARRLAAPPSPAAEALKRRLLAGQAVPPAAIFAPDAGGP